MSNGIEITPDTKRGTVLNLINGIDGLKKSGLSLSGVVTVEGLTAAEMTIVRDQLGTRKFSFDSEILDFSEGSIIFQR